MYKKAKNILKFAASVVIAGSVSLVSNVEIASATQNIEEPVNYINEIEIEDTNGWKLEAGKWYYYQDGIKKTGWLKEDTKWFYLREDGSMSVNQWERVSGTWYRFNQNGVMYDNSWYQDDNGTWYWLKSGGAMVSNQILKINNKWYRFEGSGRCIDKENMIVATVNECDILNVRSGPSANNDIVGQAKTGEYVEVLEVDNSGWNKVVLTNSTIGWVNGKLITHEENGTYNEKIKKVIDVARNKLGKSYVWGASGPDSFDCSGLTSYVYKQGAGITLPRVSRDQINAGTKVQRSELKAGDLVFFATDGKNINHVGLYIGDSEMIHSPQPGDVVRIDKVTSSYYSKNYFGATRIID